MKWGGLEKNGLRLEVDILGAKREDKRHKRKTKLNIETTALCANMRSRRQARKSEYAFVLL